MRRILALPLIAAVVFAADVAAQDQEKPPATPSVSIRWRAFRGTVEIPRPDGRPYELSVEVPDQTIVGGRVRVLLRGPGAGAAPVAAYGRFEMTPDPVLATPTSTARAGSDVAMESLQLVAEGLRLEAAPQQAASDDRVAILAYSHEVTSPRDAAPAPNAKVEIPLPEAVLKDMGR